MSTIKPIAPKTYMLDLSIERSQDNGKSLVINQDFAQLVFNRGTDKDVHVDVLTDDSSGNNPERYFNRDSLKAGVKNGNINKIQGCKIFNEAQPGKVIYITVHTDSFHDNGSLISDSEVEVLIPNSGTEELVGITATNVTQKIVNADPTVKAVHFENRLGRDCLIKFNSDNDKRGRTLRDGASFTSFNSGDHWVNCDTGGGAIVANAATGVGLNITKEY